MVEQSKGKRHSKAELDVWRSKFQCFNDPFQFEQLFDELHEIIGYEEFYKRGGLQFMREAFAAAKFGQLTNADNVQLIPEQAISNDCEVKVGSKTSIYEITEVLETFRRRGSEYKGSNICGLKPISEKEKRKNFVAVCMN